MGERDYVCGGWRMLNDVQHSYLDYNHCNLQCGDYIVVALRIYLKDIIRVFKSHKKHLVFIKTTIKIPKLIDTLIGIYLIHS